MIRGILGIGLLLRLISLNQSLWLDEGINVMAAKNFSFFGMLTQYSVADFHPPGWFAILWIWGKAFGYSEIAVRIPSVIFGVLTIYITYLIGKKISSRNLGLAAALLLSINPLHIFYSQEARMYSLAALAVTVNIYLLIKIIKLEKVHILLLIFSNLLILLSDYVAYFIFPTQLIYLLIYKKSVIKKWLLALAGALILNIPWLPVFLKQLDVGASASANLPTWKFVVGGFDFKTVPLTFVKFIIGRISLADKTIYAAVLLPVCTLFLYLIARGARKLLLFWLVIPPLIATIISLFIPVYSYFRVLFVIPAFVILTAGGILSSGKKLRLFFLGTVILIQLFCTSVYLVNPKFQREDWRGLVSYFQSVQAKVILFESSGTFPPFDYYAKGSLNAKGALKDFPARDEDAVADLEVYEEVYLVDYLVQISDPGRLVAKKLTDSGFKITGVKDFHGVGFVYRYVK